MLWPFSFQFHKGTIKTSPTGHIASAIAVFQFHKGTIKTFAVAMKQTQNSLFQFHKGTIKTLYPDLPDNDYFISIP